MYLKKISLAVFVVLSLAACGNDEKKKSEEVSRHFAAAKTYLNQAQYRSVILESKNVLKASPSHEGAIKLIAQAYNEMGAYGQAIALLEKKVANHSEFKLPLAKAYLGSKKFSSAAQTLEGVDPAVLDDNGFELMVQVSQAQGKTDEMNRWLDAFKQKFPQSPLLQLTLAKQAAMAGQLEEAKTLATGVLASLPNSIETLVLLANIAVAEKQLPVAEDYLLKAQLALPNADVFTVNKLMVISQLAEVVRLQDKISEYYAYQKVIADANPEADVAQQKYNQAVELFKKGQLTEAATVLTELLAQYPQDKNSSTLLAIIQSQQGSPSAAVQLFDKVIDPETATPAVLHAAALAKMQTKNADGALELLKQAAEKQPKNAEVTATYAAALLDKNPKDAAAAKLIEKSLALSPKLVKLRLILAKHYALTGQSELGLAQLDKAFVDKPDDLLIQKMYFSALLKENLLPKLKQEIEKLDANSKPRAQFWRGWMELEQKNLANAEKIFLSVKDEAKDDEKILILSGLAQVKELQNDPGVAILAWQKVIQADANAEAAYARLMQLGKQYNKWDEVIKALQSLANENKVWQPLAAIAQIQMEYKQDSYAAITFAQSALELSDNAPAVKTLLSRIYSAQSAQLKQQAKLEEARSVLLKAVALTPENLDLQVNLVEMELTNKNIPEAKKLLDQYTKAGMNASALAYLGAIIRVADGKVDESIGLFLQSWKNTPTIKSAEAIYGYYMATKKPDEAVKFLDDWMAKLPDHPAPIIAKAMNFQQQKNNKEAISYYEKGLSIAPNAVVALNNLAWLYFEQGDAKALPLAKKAVELAPESAEILDTYAWILYKSGKPAEAKPLLEKAAQLAPNNKEIAEHLQALKK